MTINSTSVPFYCTCTVLSTLCSVILQLILKTIQDSFYYYYNLDDEETEGLGHFSI